jgi:protease I
MKGLILTADDFEEAELLVPYYRLQEAGLAVDVAAPRRGRVRGKHGYPFEAPMSFADIAPLQHDALVIPGGPAAEALADDKAAVRIAVWFLEEHRPVAAICHGPLVLVETGLMEEREATGHPSIELALRAKRVRYVDQEVVNDGEIVTSRRPADLPAFMRELMKLIERRHSVGAR